MANLNLFRKNQGSESSLLGRIVDVRSNKDKNGDYYTHVIYMDKDFHPRHRRIFNPEEYQFIPTNIVIGKGETYPTQPPQSQSEE